MPSAKQWIGSIACFATAGWIIAEAVILYPRPAFDFQALVTLIIFAPAILALICGGVGSLIDRFKSWVLMGLLFGFAIWVLIWRIVIMS